MRVSNPVRAIVYAGKLHSRNCHPLLWPRVRNISYLKATVEASLRQRHARAPRRPVNAGLYQNSIHSPRKPPLLRPPCLLRCISGHCHASCIQPYCTGAGLRNCLRWTKVADESIRRCGRKSGIPDVNRCDPFSHGPSGFFVGFEAPFRRPLNWYGV